MKSYKLCITDKMHQNTGFILAVCHCLSSLTFDVFFIIGTLFSTVACSVVFAFLMRDGRDICQNCLL